ncbi:DNA-binding protein [Streptomyces chrestomyceticus JCM 4735]|uniref:DNA-binding protein n=1 Tax=Streptomyces chrestomyceticus JCM 4735 TaxID=1306181 RepID=A0A7U9KT29_9ACTN|nr:DNA-binding protein [Streptomyces chrestomyceticus JCM 4735]
MYTLSACLLFGTSALYHRGTWGRRGEAVLRRLDHANIFLIIAGTYTPLAVLLLPAGQQRILLSLVWGGATAGIAFRVFWINAPRWLYTLCYIALGWAAVFYLPDFAHTGGTAVVALIIVGGLLYTAGAAVYGLKRPDPSPTWSASTRSSIRSPSPRSPRTTQPSSWEPPDRRQPCPPQKACTVTRLSITAG